MRIMMLLCLTASTAFALAACGSEAPSPEPEPSPVATESPTVSPQSICPQAWTCDYRHWYGTDAACHSYCPNPAACNLDYRCGVGCICP